MSERYQTNLPIPCFKCQLLDFQCHSGQTYHVLKITKCAARHCAHARVPPSGGGPGSILDLVVMRLRTLWTTLVSSCWLSGSALLVVSASEKPGPVMPIPASKSFGGTLDP